MPFIEFLLASLCLEVLRKELKHLVGDLSQDKEMLQDVIRRKYEACAK
jgi:hypothetical protein